MAETTRENDLVLGPNEFAFVLDTTKGNVSSVVGPYKMSLSASDKLVVFDEVIKQFVEVEVISQAIQTFITAPENWYIQLKNPTKDGSYPLKSTSNVLPELEVGKKINIPGNTSFALYPGQMAKVICGHRMRSNQYLKARVYDAVAANPYAPDSSSHGNDDDETREENKVEKYVTGQILIIKGSDTPFYIPPTGIEVLPINSRDNNLSMCNIMSDEEQYIRNALTLEKLQYCILVDESGKRTYIHGPAVVFPRPDQSFVENTEDCSCIFKAIELTDRSGVYVKVIDEYEDDCGVKHHEGEELFITGKDQAIYFPREEHSFIDYDGLIVYHAIAIPVGEGRYILNRNTGEVKTVTGPQMYLPDPRYEVVLKRFLTKDQCELWYPNNSDVLMYNLNKGEYDPEDAKDKLNIRYDLVSLKKSGTPSVVKGFSRGTQYTPPRTISLENKFDGAVSISVRTGYAVNVVSKDGSRKVIVGPQTILLDYDQTLEVFRLSTGIPKSSDIMIKDVYLQVQNNKITDVIDVVTSDLIDIRIKVKYTVDFLLEYKDMWFEIENYIKYLCDRERSFLKATIRDFTFETFNKNSDQLIRYTLLGMFGEDDTIEDLCNISEDDLIKGMMFLENGMCVSDVEILYIEIMDSFIRDIVQDCQIRNIQDSFKLSESKKKLEIEKEQAKIEKEISDTKAMVAMFKNDKEKEIELRKHLNNNEVLLVEYEQDKNAMEHNNTIEEMKKKSATLQAEFQTIIHDQKIDANKKEDDLTIRKLNETSKAIISILDSISSELTTALNDASNCNLIGNLAENMSPYALASNESVVDITTQLLKGTSLETSIGRILSKIDRTIKMENSNDKEF